MAIEHVDISTGEIHEPKGITSAVSGQVYVADGLGSGSWATVGGERLTEVIVNQASDFPTPVSDVITLAADTIYILDGDIDVGNDRFIMSANSAIRGLGTQVSTLTSSTSGVLFTASANFHLDSFAVNASSATIFSCTGGGFESCYLRNFTVNTCSTVGAFNSWYSLFWQAGAVAVSTSALSFTGACTIMILDLVEWITGYTTAVDLGTATFNNCSFHRCGFQYASATNHINVAASGANLNSGKVGRIAHTVFNTSATNVVNGYASADVQWKAESNEGLEDTAKNAQGYMHTTTVTTIGAGDGDSGNPKLVTGSTNWVDAISDQFTITTGGRFTYIGLTDVAVLASCSISGTAASGTQTFRHYIAKNGTVITASMTEREYSSTAVGSPSPCFTIVTLSTNDYLELYVENVTGTNNWSSEVLNMVIKER